MKVLLINSTATRFTNRQKAPSSPLGLLAIASYIKAKGHSVKIVDLTIKTENIEKHIKSFNPDVVGLSVITTLASNSAVKASKTAKKHNKPVIWGGNMASSLPELCFKEGCVDFVVMGEGEITFSELLNTIEKGGSFYNIDGLAFIDKDGIHINKERAFADLSTFPIIDWSLVDPKKYCQVYFLSKRMLYSYLSKGCPGHCTFCYNPNYNRSTHRTRPPVHAAEEIEYLVKNCSVDGINFADEFLYPGKEDMQTFFRLIKEKHLDFKWGGQTRLGAFNKEELQQMYDAGCRWLLFGIESGCPERIRKIKKGINLEKAKETFDNCREIGITAQSSFIIGYPGETEEELKETVSFAHSLNANLCPLNILYLQAGSEILESAVNNGQYNPPRSLKEWSKIEIGEISDMNLSKVPRKDLLVIHFHFQWEGFSTKEAVNSDSYGIAKKMAADALRNMVKFGFINFFIGGFVSVKKFFTVVWYAKAYPKVLKKYGLDKHN